MPKVTIDKEKCTECGNCIDICPVEVFAKDENGKVIVKNEGDCIACKACEVQCPVEAIKVEED